MTLGALLAARRAMSRLWELASRFWFEALVLVGLGFGLAAAAVGQTHKDGPEGPLWFDVLVVIGFTMPLIARRRFPVGAPVAVALAVGSSTFVDNRLIPYNFIAFLVALVVAVTFGMLPRPSRSIAGIVFLIGIEAIVVNNDPKGHWGDIAWVAIVFTIAWIIGFAIGNQVREVDQAREHATRAERNREEQATLAVAEERARIARELHDVVGHSVSVMTVQASAVRRLLEPDQVKENEALLVVEQTGREALAEMRRMVGVLRQSEEPPAAPA